MCIFHVFAVLFMNIHTALMIKKNTNVFMNLRDRLSKLFVITDSSSESMLSILRIWLVYARGRSRTMQMGGIIAQRGPTPFFVRMRLIL